MPDKLPIDDARADADVVRKKFRRQVVMFVIATIVAMVAGRRWIWELLQLREITVPERTFAYWMDCVLWPTDSFSNSFDELRSSTSPSATEIPDGALFSS